MISIAARRLHIPRFELVLGTKGSALSLSDVGAYGFTSMAAMTFTAIGGDTKIGFDADNSVTLVGISDPNTLHASDFIFA